MYTGKCTRYNANCVKAFEYKKDLESLRVEGIVNIREEHVDGTVKIIGGEQYEFGRKRHKGRL